MRREVRKTADPEIAALRKLIAARPRVTEIAQLRLDIDARGLQFPIGEGATVERISAGGVAAEWIASFGDRSAIDPTTQKAGILDMAQLYFGGADSRTPFAAPTEICVGCRLC